MLEELALVACDGLGPGHKKSHGVNHKASM